MILAITGDVVALCYRFSGLKHRPINFWLVLIQPGVIHHVHIHFILHARDGFNPTGSINVSFTCNHALRCCRNGLQTRRAKAIDGHARRRYRTAAAQGDLASNVKARCTFRIGAANNHVFYLPSFNPSARYSCLQSVSTQGCTMGHVEGAFPRFGEGRACSRYDDGVGHRSLQKCLFYFCRQQQCLRRA